MKRTKRHICDRRFWKKMRLLLWYQNAQVNFYNVRRHNVIWYFFHNQNENERRNNLGRRHHSSFVPASGQHIMCNKSVTWRQPRRFYSCWIKNLGFLFTSFWCVSRFKLTAFVTQAKSVHIKVIYCSDVIDIAFRIFENINPMYITLCINILKKTQLFILDIIIFKYEIYVTLALPNWSMNKKWHSFFYTYV